MIDLSDNYMISFLCNCVKYVIGITITLLLLLVNVVTCKKYATIWYIYSQFKKEPALKIIIRLYALLFAIKCNYD